MTSRHHTNEKSITFTLDQELYEGPCLEVVPVMLLPAAPNSYDSALIVAIRHSYLGARLYLFTHRLLKQPPLRDEHVSSRYRLQSVLNSSARLILKLGKYDPISQSNATFTGCQSKLVYASR